MPTLTSAPTNEQGRVAPGGVAPWALFIGDELERVPELQWPKSIETYALMRNDTQVDGLLRGATLPIRRYDWFLKENGAQPAIVEAVAADLGLPVEGKEEEPKRRAQRRFSWDTHLFHVLLALPYGHMYFEQVGEIVDGLWRLRKLAPRMPITISEIQVAQDGGLVYIKQNVGVAPPEISVDRLAAYIWDKEGANWVGRSMLRSAYKNWLIKDRLLRIDAIKHERNGVGMPVLEAPPGASGPQLKEFDAMAQEYKAGERGGGAVPSGSKLRLVGTEGSLPDTVDSIRYHDEQMAGSFLEMFKQLGTTQTGSRALGSSFVDYFELAQESIAIWARDVTNEHVIEDWVDWNYGEEEQAPLLAFKRSDASNVGIPGQDPNNPVAPLDQAVQDGQVTVSPDTAAEIKAARQDWDARHATSPMSSSLPAKSRRQRVRAAGELSSQVPLPPRPLRRLPYDFEVAASVDFAQMDSDWQHQRDLLVTQVETLQRTQRDELHDAIVGAKGDVGKLAQISAEPVAAEQIKEHMLSALEMGVNQAMGEAERQGKTLARPSLTAAESSVAARAEAVDAVLARSISEAAARKALNLTGGSLSNAAVADATRTYLAGLSNSYLADQLGGAIQAAINAGRKEVFKKADPQHIYASELLDANTCEECTGNDGQEYADMDAAEADYPTGGFTECLGGPRCRGTLVAVYDEEGPE